MSEPGTLYLVGAGPGDPGLITVAGLRRLKEADVIVYDRLVSEALLREARPDAELIFVGKVAGAPSTPPRSDRGDPSPVSPPRPQHHPGRGVKGAATATYDLKVTA
jgi:hypothetical protein